MKAIIKRPIIPNVIYVEDINNSDKDRIFTFKNKKKCVIGRLGVWYYWYYDDSDYYTIADEKIRGGSVRDLVDNTCGSNAIGFSGIFFE